MKRHVFRRVFILHTAILLFSVIFVEFYITSVVRDNYLTTLKSSLSVQAGLISADAALLAKSNLDKLCRQLKHKTGARVTVIDAQGKVLGDSDSASRSMDNHADRPEIQKSLRTETGWSIRHSDTLEYDLLYVAHTIVKDRNVQGFVRLALPPAGCKQVYQCASS